MADKILSPVVTKATTAVSTGINNATNNIKAAIGSRITAPLGTAQNRQQAQTLTAEQAFKKTDKFIYKINVVQASSDPQNPLVAVSAFLPEQISLDLSASYTPAFGEGVFDTSDLVGKGARLLGYSGITQEMSIKIWESSEGIQVSIPLVFVAGELIDRQGYSSVIDPILQLSRLVVPRKIQGDVFLTPPGPKLVADFAQVGKTLQSVGSLASNSVLDVAAGALDTFTTGTANFDFSRTLNSAKQVGQDFSNIIRFDSKISVYIGNFLYFDNVVVNNVSQGYDMILDENGKPMRATVNLTFTTMFTPTLEDLQKIFLRNPNGGT